MLTLGLATAASGCVATGTATVRSSASVELVAIAPGVYVVEDYPVAVFYSDGYYWRYRSGVWFRSTYYDTGFVRVRAHIVPTRVRRIDRPRRYVRYHGRASARRRAVVRDRRDHRSERREAREDRRDKRRHRRRGRRR